MTPAGRVALEGLVALGRRVVADKASPAAALDALRRAYRAVLAGEAPMPLLERLEARLAAAGAAPAVLAELAWLWRNVAACDEADRQAAALAATRAKMGLPALVAAPAVSYVLPCAECQATQLQPHAWWCDYWQRYLNPKVEEQTA